MFLPDPASCGPTVVASTAAPTGLSKGEIDAATIGRADAARYGWDAAVPRSQVRRLFGRLLFALTGIEKARPLADQRLELIRLFSCMIRRGDRRASGIAADLLGLGYTQQALHQALVIALA